MKKIVMIILLYVFVSINLSFANPPTQVNNGRYVLYQHPTFRGDQYLLDTQTGKIWRLVKAEKGLDVWEEMFFDCFNVDKTYLGRFTNPR